LRHAWKVGVVLLGVAILPPLSQARDFGVLLPPIHQGKFTSSVLYEHLKVREDFNTRGKADFTSHVVGTQFTYGLSDVLAVGIKGGALVDPKEEAQGSEWIGSAGYLYGIDLFNEVFPATNVHPGIMASMGATGFMAPFHSIVGSTTTINQRMNGVDYHAAVVASMKWKIVQPYAGIRIFGRSVNWKDNQPIAGQPANIVGHAHGNISVALGLPVRLTQDIQFHAEAILVNETRYTAGFTVAAF
jgi:hypothetical protein